jgi:hypothetical protein
MFSKVHFNYTFTVKVYNDSYSQTYIVDAQAKDDALQEAIELFYDEFDAHGSDLTASIVSYVKS